MSRPKQYSSSFLPDVVAVDALQARITSHYMNEINCQCMNQNSLEHPKRTEIDELDTYIQAMFGVITQLFVPVLASDNEPYNE